MQRERSVNKRRILIFVVLAVLMLSLALGDAFATISFPGTGTTAQSTGTISVTINVPTGTAQYDLLLAQVTYNRTGAMVATPALTGWTLVNNTVDASNQVGQAIFRKVASASEPSSYTFTAYTGTSGSPRITGAMLRYSGVNRVTPIASSNTNNGSGTTITASAVPLGSTASLVAAFLGVDNNVAIALPSGMTSRASLVHGTTGPNILAAEQTMSGSWAAHTSAIGDSPWVAQVVALNANAAPVGVADPSYTVNEDSTLTVLAATGVLANDTDAEGNARTATLITGPANALSFSLSADGSFIYTPTANWYGVTTFVYQAFDGQAYSANTTVTITVSNVNDAPQASTDSYSTNEDTTLTITATLAGVSPNQYYTTGVLANDTDIDGVYPLTAVKLTDPSHGSVTLLSTGGFTYVPTANYNGPDSFTYQAFDTIAYSAAATVNITVNSVNDPPTSANKTVTTNEDTTYTFLTSDFSFTDVDTGAALSKVKISSLQSAGALKYNAADVTFLQEITVADITAGKLTFVPAPNANGSPYATFRFMVSDGTDYSVADYTMTVDVTPVNDAPVAVDDTYSTPFVDSVGGTTITRTVTTGWPYNTGLLSDDTDVDGNTLNVATAYRGSRSTTYGTVDISANGSFTYTWTGGSGGGTDYFYYKANDGLLDSSLATVTITIGANTAPTVDAKSAATNEDTPVAVTLTYVDAGVPPPDADLLRRSAADPRHAG